MINVTDAAFGHRIFGFAAILMCIVTAYFIITI